MTDRCFFQPRALFIAGEINVQDAINLVVYAKFPLKTRLTGKDLIAGSVRVDRNGHSTLSDGESLKRTLTEDFAQEVSALRYPVGPSTYEPLLIEMLETGVDELPFFVHDHILLVDHRCRAALFVQLYSELQDAVSRGEISVWRADSQQTDILTVDCWMSERILMRYLKQQDVKRWWEVTSNLNRHDRLERILISEALQSSNCDFIYELGEIPSFVFAHMLLNRTLDLRDLAPLPEALNPARLSGLSQSDSEFANAHYKPRKLHPRPGDIGATAAAPIAPEGIESDAPATPHADAASLVVRAAPTAAPTILPARLSEASDCATTASLPRSVECSATPLPIGKETPMQGELSAQNEDDLLSKKDIARLLGKHPNSVDNYRKDPEFPKPIRVGSTPRWRRGVFMRWLDAQEHLAR